MNEPSTPSTPSPHAAGLLARIEDRTAVVGVIGQGYVGLPLALVFVEAGFPVVGFDVDPEKIASLERGESYIRHIAAQAGPAVGALSADEFSRYDCLVLSTAHAEFKERALYAGVRMVVDTRNVVKAGWAERVVRG